MRRWMLVLVIVLLLIVPAIVLADEVHLPGVLRAWRVATPTPDAAGQRIAVPPGFRISIFAEGLTAPRFMAFGPDGALYVSEPSADRVSRLVDTNGDGLAEAPTVVADGLSSPHGLEWRDGWLYVAELGRVDRLRDADGDNLLETRELVTDNIPGAGGHWTRTLHFGPDGMLYVSAGSSCNVCEESDPRRAAILRFNADGSIPADNPFAADADSRRQAVWATGLRNSVDFVFAADGQLWADHNGSDGLGDDVPPEEIVISVQGGQSHGWPYCYTPVLGANPASSQAAEVRDDRTAPPDGFVCADAVPAIFTDLAHSAPLGMAMGAAGDFPSDYADDLYVAYHGSWNTTLAGARDCKVVRIVIEDGVPVWSEDFANGWRAPGGLCGDPASFGRPADVVFGPDGAMFISDDVAGRIYRVVYVG